MQGESGMSDVTVKNNPKKEFVYALGGIALFLGVVLLIGISAFLRPAGQHITVEAAETSVAADEAEATATQSAAPVEDSADTTVGSGEIADSAEAVADATVTPAPDTGEAIVATESAAATADGTVDQAAAADADLTAEQADGDLEGEVEADPAQ